MDANGPLLAPQPQPAAQVPTVPPVILAAPPELPADAYYRFLGQNLILHDTRADLILDKIEHAVTCPRR